MQRIKDQPTTRQKIQLTKKQVMQQTKEINEHITQKWKEMTTLIIQLSTNQPTNQPINRPVEQ
jgi:hypothetical protein